MRIYNKSELKCYLHVLWQKAPQVRSKQEETCLWAEDARAGRSKAQTVVLAGASMFLGAGSVLERQTAMTGQVGVLTGHRTPHPPAKPLRALFAFISALYSTSLSKWEARRS